MRRIPTTLLAPSSFERRLSMNHWALGPRSSWHVPCYLDLLYKREQSLFTGKNVLHGCPLSRTLQLSSLSRRIMTRLSLISALSGILISSSLGADPIKIGVLEDQSGDFALATICKVHGIQRATAEINAKGGIAGRPIQLIFMIRNPITHVIRSLCV